MSQSELARQVGIAQPTLSDIELGKQPDVTSALLKRLAQRLACTTDYLVGMYEEEDSELSTAVVAMAW
jgi:transcriptional regulator with XRE-family HTH domain